MKVILGVVGAVVGGLLGEFIGFVIGAALGVAIASMLPGQRKADADGKAAGLEPAPTTPKATNAPWQMLPETPPPAVEPLSTRVTRLEAEVAALRLQVARLAAGSPVDAAATDVAVASTSAPAQAVADPVPLAPEPLTAVPPISAMPADIPATAPAVLSVPAAPTEPEHVDTHPMPLDDTPAPLAAEPDAPALPPSPPAVPRPRPPRVPEPTLEERLPPVLAKLVFGGNTIVKVGVLILFLGLAFLLRYAAERVTVPVEVRYAGVALLGAALLALGWRLRDRKDAYGLILQGAGIGVFYLTTLAALKVSHLLPPTLAFGFLFAITLLSAALAVLQNAPWLAYVAAAEGFAAPVLVSTGSGNHIALFSYLAVLDLGILLIAWFRAWRPLNLIGAVGTFTLASAWAGKHHQPDVYPGTQAFLLFFFVLFTVVGVLFARRALAQGDTPDPTQPLSTRAAQTLDQVGRVDSTLAFGVPLAAFGLQYLMVRDLPFGPAWAALGFSLFYLLLGGTLLRGGNVRYALLGEAQVIVSVIFGTLAIPLALEGQWTGATWAIEAAGMYWLGVRQQRRYARAFAVVVLAAAAVRLFTSLGIDLSPGTPLLTGSALGMGLLAAAALAMFAVAHRAGHDRATDLDAAGAIAPLWTALAAVATLAWLLLPPMWACVATSGIALAGAAAQLRLRLPALQFASAALHAVAFAAFAATVHRTDGSAMLDNGWRGLVAAVLIGASLLASTWLAVRAAAQGPEPRRTGTVSLGTSVGLLAGLGLVAASLLFVMPADDAARLWPWLGVAALWIGLRTAQPALAIAWAALQLASGVAFGAYGPPLWTGDALALTLWTPLVLTVAGFVSGDLLQRAAARDERAPSPVQWAVVLWSLAWWSQVLLPDTWRHLPVAADGTRPLWTAVLVGSVTATSVLLTALSRWRDWRVAGVAAWATVPAWACVALANGGWESTLPHAHLGWLVWPLALVWHGLLLRALPRWCAPATLAPLHVAGFWLFLWIAATEVQGWTRGLGADGSAWQMLGWVVVPAAMLALVSRPAVLARWPFAAFRTAYLIVAAAPVAVYLLLWLWASNLRAGSPAPLPYVPLLNPLEVGHGLVLLALFLWGRALPESARPPRTPALAVLGATLFALYTGIVLRTCHHWAGISWDAQALFDSTLTQAALSVAWSVVGVALMMLGHRRVMRPVWVVGAALLALVVLKLFFVELADQGGLSRIVSFIVVGLLLLVVGYFAPVPPARAEAPRAP